MGRHEASDSCIEESYRCSSIALRQFGSMDCISLICLHIRRRSEAVAVGHYSSLDHHQSSLSRPALPTSGHDTATADWVQKSDLLRISSHKSTERRESQLEGRKYQQPISSSKQRCDLTDIMPDHPARTTRFILAPTLSSLSKAHCVGSSIKRCSHKAEACSDHFWALWLRESDAGLAKAA